MRPECHQHEVVREPRHSEERGRGPRLGDARAARSWPGSGPGPRTPDAPGPLRGGRQGSRRHLPSQPARPAAPCACAASFRPVGVAWSDAPPLVPTARARFPGAGPRPSAPAPGLGTAPRAVTATAALAGQRQQRPGSELTSHSGLQAGSGRVPRLSHPRHCQSGGREEGLARPTDLPNGGLRRDLGASLQGLPAWRCGEYPGPALGVPSLKRAQAPFGSPSRKGEPFNIRPFKKAHCMSSCKEQCLS